MKNKVSSVSYSTLKGGIFHSTFFVKECFKLKCLTFLGNKTKEIDKGEVDIEMMDSYVQNDQ